MVATVVVALVVVIALVVDLVDRAMVDPMEGVGPLVGTVLVDLVVATAVVDSVVVTAPVDLVVGTTVAVGSTVVKVED